MTQELLPNFLWKVSEVSRNSGEICPPNVLFLSSPPTIHWNFRNVRSFCAKFPMESFWKYIDDGKYTAIHQNFWDLLSRNYPFFFCFLKAGPEALCWRGPTFSITRQGASCWRTSTSKGRRQRPARRKRKRRRAKRNSMIEIFVLALPIVSKPWWRSVFASVDHNRNLKHLIDSPHSPTPDKRTPFFFFLNIVYTIHFCNHQIVENKTEHEWHLQKLLFYVLWDDSFC